MGILSRIGIALDSDLLKRFDRSIGRCGYTNRSEAFRDLIRDRLVTEQTAASDGTVAGTVTLIYEHHASCLEVLIVHGQSAQVKQFADRLIGLKGVQHGRLVMTVPANSLERCRKRVHENSLNR